MDIKYLTPDDLTDSQIDRFWEQNVNMDDWDYMILLPSDVPVSEYEDNGVPMTIIWKNSFRDVVIIIWFADVEFDGDYYLVGVAYRS